MSPRLVIVLGVLLLAGCSTVRQIVREEPNDDNHTTLPTEQGRYEAVLGQSAEVVAELRATPAPDAPVMSDGKNLSADEQTLGAQGYLRIGTGYFPGADTEARANALRQGQRVAADKVVVYPGGAGGNAAASNLTAAYYIHFKPPFGASFRDLNPAERTALGVDGGVNIGAVIGGTPAAAANLRAGDMILTLADKPIANKAAFQEALRANAGKRVTLGISREGVLITRIVRVGLLPLPARKP